VRQSRDSEGGGAGTPLEAGGDEGRGRCVGERQMQSQAKKERKGWDAGKCSMGGNRYFKKAKRQSRRNPRKTKGKGKKKKERWGWKPVPRTCRMERLLVGKTGGRIYNPRKKEKKQIPYERLKKGFLRSIEKWVCSTTALLWCEVLGGEGGGKKSFRHSRKIEQGASPL